MIPAVLVLFGPPGSGKGTQSRLLTRRLGFDALSTGEMLRQEVESGTPLGAQLAQGLRRGNFATDDQVNAIAASRLRAFTGRCLILDGYPRTVEQARFLTGLMVNLGMQPPVVLHLDTPIGIVAERLAHRCECTGCRRTFHLRWIPPEKPATCDECGSLLEGRTDDQPDVIEHRLRLYETFAPAILDHFAPQRHDIDGDQPPEAVFSALESVLRASLQMDPLAASA